MQVDKKLLAPCGLYCGVCGILKAYKTGNEKFKEKLAPIYGCKPEDLVCEGCMSTVRFSFCGACPIRDCAVGKGFEGCYQCANAPCDMIKNFSFPVAQKVMLRAILEWKAMGTEKWVETVEARYKCPSCGHDLFRGAKRCNNCKTPVDLD